MKTLYMISGTMGVGKTAVCKRLKQILPNSVILDGDWCWDMQPFKVTEETKKMVIENICFMLQNFIKCSEYKNVVFCWVMHEQAIIDDILSHLQLAGVQVKSISLICNEATLISRLQEDVNAGIRTQDVIGRSVSRLPMYKALDTIKIDTSQLTIEETAEKIISTENT